QHRPGGGGVVAQLVAGGEDADHRDAHGDADPGDDDLAGRPVGVLELPSQLVERAPHRHPPAPSLAQLRDRAQAWSSRMRFQPLSLVASRPTWRASRMQSTGHIGTQNPQSMQSSRTMANRPMKSSSSL